MLFRSVLAVILFFLPYGETMNYPPTHKIGNVSPNFKMPTGHHEGAAGEEKK